jgi:hypothetical protein
MSPGGKSGAGNAWVSVLQQSNLTTFATVNLGAPSGYTDKRISHCATNSDPDWPAGGNSGGTIMVVIAGFENTGPGAGGLATWHSADGITWTSNRIVAITHGASDFWYDFARSAFYLIDKVGNLWKSTDGITFADTLTDVAIDTAKPNSLSAIGGIWTMVLTNSRLVWSIDEGVTWFQIPDPLEEASQTFAKRTFALRDRWIVWGAPLADGDPHKACYSLRLR